MTPHPNRFRAVLKTLRQVGIAPISLYGLYRLGLRSGHYRRQDSAMKREALRAAGSLKGVFVLPEPALLNRHLSRTAKAAALREANAIATGKFRPFGGRLAPLQLNFKRPVSHWSAYELDRSLRASFAFPHGDIKFAWEPGRFGWAYTLGRLFHLTHQEKYARAFWTAFERFDRGNPPYQGPHWMNGQEVAIRLMALVWSAQVFAPASASTTRRLSRLASSAAEHAARIPPTLIYARSQNNNHIVVESAALYLAGVALDSSRWKELGWRWLNRALQRQIDASGEYIQHSTNYHRLMLQAALLADAARRAAGDLWPPQTRQALVRASHWLFSMIDPASGRAPNLGANDGALILPLSSAEFADFRPTLQAAARAFLRTGLPAGDWDELALWLGLPETTQTADSAAYAADHLRGRHSWAHLQASTSKTRLAHMDQLHFDLWWRGLNVAPDAGSYLYNAPPPWDNPLVSALVHNCVTIDGLDQMTRGGRFLVLDWFPAYSKRVLPADVSVLGRIAAVHRGYERRGIRHERTVSLLEGERWQVRDDLHFARRQPHLIRLHWLLLDGEWHLQQRGTEIRLRVRLPRGWMRLLITASGFTDVPPRVTLVRAGTMLRGTGQPQPYEGWTSPSYGQKTPALSLALEAQASHTCSFITEFILPR